jgi:hypothetical protein
VLAELIPRNWRAPGYIPLKSLSDGHQVCLKHRAKAKCVGQPTDDYRDILKRVRKDGYLETAVPLIDG